MRRFLLLALSLSLVAMTTACGIPEEEHTAVLRDLANTKKRLNDTQNNLTTTEAELKRQLASVQGNKEALARSLGATQKELERLRQSEAAAAARNRVFKDLVEKLRSMIDSGKLQVEVRKGKMIVKMSDKILFDPGKTMLKEDGKVALGQLAAVLKDINDRDFLIAGHTDNVPIKTKQFKSNWELSTARAVEVVKFMQEQGVNPTKLGAAGYSEFDPVADNASEDGKRGNRRIEVVLMPNIEELPNIQLQ